MIRLAIDAMGGDFAPHEIVTGALKGARAWDVHVVLIGDPQALAHELEGLDTGGVSFEVEAAHDVVTMEDRPVKAVQSRPEASINVACRLVCEGRADGVLTMGNTGAAMIAALLNFGRLPGVERPAPIVPFLGLREGLFLLDAGANTEVRPNQLLQFARMGATYAEIVAGIAHPRVGLLSNGEEASKGNKVGREAYPLLAQAPDLNFIGNVEGHTLFSSGVHVVVTDGFTGNVLFKGAEGIVQTLLGQVSQVLASLPPQAAALVQAHLTALRERNHYARYGAAALLGVSRPMFIGHGRSKAQAVINGMKTAQRMIAGDVVGAIRSRCGPDG